MGRVYIVGAGPGSSRYLTEAVKETVSKADVIIGWRLDLLPVEDLIKNKEVYLQDVDNYIEVARRVAEKTRNSDKTIVILRVGDPCISSGLRGLLEIFEGFDVEIIPGISSIQLAAAIARINIDESTIISFHNGGDSSKKKRFMLESFKKYGRHIIMLVGPDLQPHEAADYLIANGVSGDTPVVVCESLSLPGERVFKGTLGDLSAQQFSWLAVMVIINTGLVA
ncbi:precorrin-6y C5,15-methyltransferase (decarboxylating) subunit CbiE [Conexivisphaera calida]|uniref:Cobalt-precorrin-6y C5-methyltransferase n=1 Tax=Conexivisphaera calida TaxID=1874277 RepID=A0A4P2VN62_9ARCH|nr:precorrin-6y C5,15-methyltransferase (decarboxylating) subunit CbiE [Conexivisphaera calida]BBE42385.1 Cobalt-precorrin-6y C5-methyltransferase [Conexivisphaera calida]